MDKPIIIFTNFWDAEKITKDGFASFKSKDDKRVYKVNFMFKDEKPENFEVFSIAIMKPNMDKLPFLKSNFPQMQTLNVFCPTYDILMKYKKDKKWDEYEKEFKSLMKQRLGEIKQWLDSLSPNKVYILCCWENTYGSANCHRRILYDAFSAHKKTSESNLLLYRHGGKCIETAESRIEEFNSGFLDKKDKIDVLEHEVVRGIRGSGYHKDPIRHVVNSFVNYEMPVQFLESRLQSAVGTGLSIGFSVDASMLTNNLNNDIILGNSFTVSNDDILFGEDDGI